MKSNFQWYMLGSIYIVNRLYYKTHDFLKIITSNIMKLNASTKMHDKVAALNGSAIHTIKNYLLFSYIL